MDKEKLLQLILDNVDFDVDGKVEPLSSGELKLSLTLTAIIDLKHMGGIVAGSLMGKGNVK